MPQTLAEIKDLLASRGLSPLKRFGQNFLIDQNLVRKLVDEAGVTPGELVLEVGPGTGTLTEELLGRGCEVIACELDRGLAALLRDRLGARERFALVEGDCLGGKRHVSPAVVGAIGGRPFVLVANLPYGAATPLMLALLTEHPGCRGMFVTIQREVGERLGAGARVLLAPPGCGERDDRCRAPARPRDRGPGGVRGLLSEDLREAAQAAGGRAGAGDRVAGGGGGDDAGGGTVAGADGGVVAGVLIRGWRGGPRGAVI
jgi:SAM-dependent methyltransferase